MKAKFKIGDRVTKEVPKCLRKIYPKRPLGIVTEENKYGEQL